MEYPEETYIINDTKKNFDEIKEFLTKAKIIFKEQLDSFYHKNKYINLLHGNLYIRIIQHIENKDNIDNILRFILNEKDSKKKIIDGNILTKKQEIKYMDRLEKTIKVSFTNISNYIHSLFDKNMTSLQKNYEKILLKNKYISKGIFYIKICENNSMEEIILNLFTNEIEELPVPQNILFCGEETSLDEIKSFLYKAILCEYNTLFVIGINDSFSESQRNIMCYYINTLLSYLNSEYNKINKQNIDKSQISLYLNSSIVFVFKENNKSKSSFLEEIVKIDEIKPEKFNKINMKYDNNFKNVKVVMSDVCGLGKTYKIKKMIQENKRKYYYIRLGDKLTKAIIFEKAKTLFDQIKKENKNSYNNNISIHLDLIQSEETSLINEFLFSLLITKFYVSNEDIIYIPKDIDIYIEIQNNFDNLLSKFGILNIFEKINITIENLPKLDLSKEIKDYFYRIFKYKSNEDIEKFIKTYFGNENYTYHQVHLFINLLMRLYDFGKIKFNNIENEKENKKIIDTFIQNMKYITEGCFNKYIINEDFNQKNVVDLQSEKLEDDISCLNFDNPLIFFIKEKEEIKMKEILIGKENSTKYLEKIKDILNLPNEVNIDKDNKKSLLSILNYKIDNFVITYDTFKKMILLLNRIQLNIPFILMGETGCGKTTLIIKLNQIVNNGEILLERIDINPELTEEIICNELKRINKKASNQKEEFWVFLDNINTCKSLGLITEIFTYRTFNGEKLNENIRLMGACNPYRKRKINKGIKGLTEDDYNITNDLAYLVNPLSQSLYHNIFTFGQMKEEDEKEYIYHMIGVLFKKEEDEDELHELTRDTIFKCHKYFRDNFDCSVVSLRDVKRFVKCTEFFQKYYLIKETSKKEIGKNKERLIKIKSILCSVYVCYYFRLNYEERFDFERTLKNILLNLVNYKEKNEPTEENINFSLFDEIKNQQLKEELKYEDIRNFSQIIEKEEKFLFDKIELNKEIGRNESLKENIFLSFVSIMAKIPLMIIGNPSTGKSLSVEIIIKTMKGKYSKDKFFREFPQVIPSYFQVAPDSNIDNIKELIKIAEGNQQFYCNKKENKDEEIPISLIFIDQMELSRNKTHIYNILYSKFDLDEKNINIGCIGISNTVLNSELMNRNLILYVKDLEEHIDYIKNTCRNIGENIPGDLHKNKIFEIISKTFCKYKNTLNFIQEMKTLKKYITESKGQIDFKKKLFNEIKISEKFKNLNKQNYIEKDFHCIRDLFSMIKEIKRELEKLKFKEEEEVVNIIEKSIENNFGGIDYQINLDLEFKFDDIEKELREIKEIIKEINYDKRKGKKIEKEETITINSVFLFKKIYNQICKENDFSYTIDYCNLNKYDLNRNINDYINNDINDRPLLIEVNPSLSLLFYKYIKIQNPNKKIIFFDINYLDNGNNNDLIFDKLNQIQDEAKNDKTKKLIILNNITQIPTYFYHNVSENFNEELKVMILVDKNFMKFEEKSFLSRFSKMKLNFLDLLDDENISLTKKILEEINLEHCKKENNENKEEYKGLIEFTEEQIGGMIYNIYSSSLLKGKLPKEVEIKEEVYSKLAQIFPATFIENFPDENIIKIAFQKRKRYNSVEEYLTDDKNKNYKISIIYTLSHLSDVINGTKNLIQFFISEIKNQTELINKIDEIICKNETIHELINFVIAINFDDFNINKIQNVTYFIDTYLTKGKYEKYKYILLIYLKRNISVEMKDKIFTRFDINENINHLFLEELNIINNINVQDDENKINFEKENENDENSSESDKDNSQKKIDSSEDEEEEEIFNKDEDDSY